MNHPFRHCVAAASLLGLALAVGAPSSFAAAAPQPAGGRPPVTRAPTDRQAQLASCRFAQADVTKSMGMENGEREVSFDSGASPYGQPGCARFVADLAIPEAHQPPSGYFPQITITARFAGAPPATQAACESARTELDVYTRLRQVPQFPVQPRRVALEGQWQPPPPELAGMPSCRLAGPSITIEPAKFHRVTRIAARAMVSGQPARLQISASHPPIVN